jgi:thioredoxin reductase (NADPH)
MALENVTILWDSVVEKINGEDKVECFEVKNMKTNEVASYDISGIFIAVGYIPNSEPYKKVVATDEAGYIIAGENCETSIPGIYAAGDVRTKDLRQIITATADGANAITAVEKYLNQL